MNIEFTSPAKADLAQIVEYYTNKGIRMVGRKIRAKIINHSLQLRTFPNLGKIEEAYSKKYDAEFYFLVCDNHKIIYNIDLDNNVIAIVRVFDTRQNPNKLL